MRKTTSVSFPALLGMVLLLIASRVCGVLYSAVATDVLYAEGILPTVLSYLRLILSCAAYGVGIGATVSAVYRGHGGLSMLLHVAVLFVDAVAAFLIDWMGGALGASYLIAAAAVTNLLAWMLGSLFAVLALGIARRCFRLKRPSLRAAIAASLAYMVGRLAMEIVYLLQFLIEVEFQPYAREIVQIIGGFLQILFLYGGVTSVVAWLVAARMARHTEKPT